MDTVSRGPDIAAPSEELEWGSVDVSELFVAPDASKAALRMSRGLLAAPAPPPFPSSAAAHPSPHKFDPRQTVVIDTYFTPRLAQLVARADAASFDITKPTRTLQSPYQLLFERRLAVLHRVNTAIAGLYSDGDEKEFTSKPQRQTGVIFPILDAHQSVASGCLFRKPEQLSVAGRASVGMLLVLLKSLAASDQGFAADVVARLDGSLAALRPLSLTSQAVSVNSGGVASSLHPFLGEIVGLLRGLASSLPQHRASVYRTWLTLALACGSLVQVLDFIAHIQSHGTPPVILACESMLDSLKEHRPVPYLASPLPPSLYHAAVKFALPPDVPAPCIAGVVVDAVRGFAVLLIPRYGLVKLTLDKRARVVRLRLLDGLRRKFSKKFWDQPPDARSPSTTHPQPYTGTTAPIHSYHDAAPTAVPSRVPGDHMYEVLGEVVDETFHGNSRDEQDQVQPYHNPGGNDGPEYPPRENEPTAREEMPPVTPSFNPIQDQSVVSMVKLDQNYLMTVTCHNVETSRPANEAWHTASADFDAVVIDVTTLSDVCRWRASVDFTPDATPHAPLSQVPVAAFTVTRAVSADEEVVLFLTSFNLLFGNRTSAVAHRLFQLPTRSFLPADSGLAKADWDKANDGPACMRDDEYYPAYPSRSTSFAGRPDDIAD
eukprot:gene22599-34575_t